jgi:protoheme IX farnesyltransferase
LAGAAAVDPGLTAAPVILAVVLFLWTPPHFWSLAAALRDDYARAGVPMLPVVVGDALAAKVIFAHTLALVLLSVIPGFISLGWIYLLGAAAGGSYFVAKSWRLVRNPTPKAAMTNFFASLVQLCLMLIGAMADRLLLG